MNEDVSKQVQSTIDRISNTIENQVEINLIWDKIKTIFLGEMSKLPDLPKSSDSKCNKNFQKSQPFWNEELGSIWREVCRTEREYTGFKVSSMNQLEHKNILRANFRYTRKLFDKKYRYFKRKHRKEEFEQLSNDAEGDPAEMWAKVRRLCDPPSTRTALEVIREDGTISTDVREILRK